MGVADSTLPRTRRPGDLHSEFTEVARHMQIFNMTSLGVSPGIPSREQYGGFVFVRYFLRKRCDDDIDLFYGWYDENARENQPP